MTVSYTHLQSAVLGGGRYDGLIEECGGKSTPCLLYTSVVIDS